MEVQTLIYYLHCGLCVCVLRLGSWQFLVELPYTAASRAAIWRLLWTMHQHCVTMATSSDVTGATSRDCDDVTAPTRCVSLTADECRQQLAGLSTLQGPHFQKFLGRS